MGNPLYVAHPITVQRAMTWCPKNDSVADLRSKGVYLALSCEIAMQLNCQFGRPKVAVFNLTGGQVVLALPNWQTSGRVAI